MQILAFPIFFFLSLCHFLLHTKTHMHMLLWASSPLVRRVFDLFPSVYTGVFHSTTGKVHTLSLVHACRHAEAHTTMQQRDPTHNRRTRSRPYHFDTSAPAHSVLQKQAMKKQVQDKHSCSSLHELRCFNHCLYCVLYLTVL